MPNQHKETPKHLLIDFENIQPTGEQLEIFENNTHVWLFLGVQHKHISIDLAQALHRFIQVNFIHLQEKGKNALDFCLALYIGRITENDKQADIVIISKDRGYDPLINLINNNHLCASINRVEYGQNTLSNNTEKNSDHYQKIVALVTLKKNRPRKKKTLKNHIKHHLSISGKEAELIIKRLQESKVIRISDNDRITYPKKQ